MVLMFLSIPSPLQYFFLSLLYQGVKLREENWLKLPQTGKNVEKSKIANLTGPVKIFEYC